MKQAIQTVWHTVQHNVTGWCLLALLPALAQSTYADTITIGKGSGIVWEGMPFNVSNQGRVHSYVEPVKNNGDTRLGFIAPIDTGFDCLRSSNLTTIAGYKVFQIAPGVGLVPRLTMNASYVLADGTPETLNGTIGLPNTQGNTSPSGIAITNPINGDEWWCLAPRITSIINFYKIDSYINVTATGTWVMIADGTQTNQDDIIIPSFFSFWTVTPTSIEYKQILPNSISLRISTLECTVSTPVQINFGPVALNRQSGAELASQTNSLITQCTQDSSVGITANINLQFRALTGLYENTPSRLALSQGGGYITGEINNAVTGSGSCLGTSGLSFDNTPLKVGSITSTQGSHNTVNQVTWRLCSGGNNLPTGDVSAAAEMLVTFN